MRINIILSFHFLSCLNTIWSQFTFKLLLRFFCQVENSGNTFSPSWTWWEPTSWVFVCWKWYTSLEIWTNIFYKWLMLIQVCPYWQYKFLRSCTLYKFFKINLHRNKLSKQRINLLLTRHKLRSCEDNQKLKPSTEILKLNLLGYVAQRTMLNFSNFEWIWFFFKMSLTS